METFERGRPAEIGLTWPSFDEAQASELVSPGGCDFRKNTTRNRAQPIGVWDADPRLGLCGGDRVIAGSA